MVVGYIIVKIDYNIVMRIYKVLVGNMILYIELF